MATGPFQYDPATREFKRRDSARPWAADEHQDVGLAAALLDADAEGFSAATGGDALSGGFAHPAGTRRRRRRSYEAEDVVSPKKSKLWKGAMWGLILVLLIGWLVMIAVLTSRSGSNAPGNRTFEFDRGEVVGPNSLVPPKP